MKTTMSSFGNKKINFPTSYDLKIIVDSKVEETITRKEFEEIASTLEVPNYGWTSKLSKAGNYTSYTTRVMIKDQEIMDNLYSDLKKITGLKMAI
ncbi:MAG: DUF493 domain-containing protein [Hyphomicrobiales bacterium]